MANKENKHTMTDLYQMQSLPLSAKIRMTQNRINWWVDEFGEDGVYDQKDSAGFISLYGLPSVVRAKMKASLKKEVK